MTLSKTIIIENIIFLYLIIASVFSCPIYSQKINASVAKIKDTITKSSTDSATISNLVKTVISYKVVEKINMTFGGYTVTYVVSDISLINTTDLGPNNTRIVTPIFDIKRQNIKTIKRPVIDSLNLMPVNFDSNITVNFDIPEKPVFEEIDISNGTEYIDIVKTYERVVDKGFKSIEMLKRIANAYYFDNKLDKAAKYYQDLFNMTTDLEPEYYFRYAKSLKFINKQDKANEMMKIFNQKNNGL
ncbi:hypothetical protein GCM10008015_13890 [Flavobacterium palustre]|uniref:Tetratricopeptide repeat protein n=1 Tax=Flavobacterium palustre TaxID=1476463 RepID=A0ABQ1HEY6_9FLAO|nr:hypothetical protein [Flavobacterium palustre]GGA74451.1 hypothetical protein GCM10008015_13890 [Flavobacterium palustre]